MIKYFLPIFVIFFSHTFFAQTLDEIKHLYETFEFQNVIEQSELLLNSTENNEEKIELYLLKGVSEYSLGNDKQARSSFIELLKIDSSFVISTSRFSPKIVELFDEVKSNYLSIKKESVIEKTIEEPIIKTEIKFLDNSSTVADAALKNILLPGWGQLSAGNSTKGYLLGGTSLTLLGSMIYYIISTDNKYQDYISETNSLAIENKYQEYNDSYKIRNLFIFSYAAVWIYSQIDLFIFTEFNLPDMEVSSSVNNELTFNFSIPFN